MCRCLHWASELRLPPLSGMQGRPGGVQGGMPGLSGLGGRLGGLSGLGAGGSGYGAPSGDLLSMLNKTGGQAQRQEQQHGGHDGPAFDASDFPSLSAAAAASGQHRSADAGGSETFAALLGSQQKPGAGGGQGAQGTGPSFGEEDFPALPGSGAQPSSRQQQQDGSEGAAQLQQLQQQLGSLADGGGGGAFGSLDLARLQQQRQLAAQQQQQALKGVGLGGPGAAAAASTAGGKLTGIAPQPQAQPDRFGLLGLLSVIRMTGASRVADPRPGMRALVRIAAAAGCLFCAACRGCGAQCALSPPVLLGVLLPAILLCGA